MTQQHIYHIPDVDDLDIVQCPNCGGRHCDKCHQTGTVVIHVSRTIEVLPKTRSLKLYRGRK